MKWRKIKKRFKKQRDAFLSSHLQVEIPFMEAGVAFSGTLSNITIRKAGRGKAEYQMHFSRTAMVDMAVMESSDYGNCYSIEYEIPFEQRKEIKKKALNL